jgi:3D (Asp-Asp-Asp) domain-containing protein
MKTMLLKLGLISATFAGLTVFGAPPPHKLNGTYVATAYSVTGITASGEYTHRHVVAADPDVLPIGSRIKIRRAGKYSGEYVVADTGSKIVGRKLDIYLPSTPECMKFGKKPVRIRVLEIGKGTHESAKQADQVVKQHVATDVAHGVVGNAATEHDWATKGGPVKAAVTSEAATAAPAEPVKVAATDTPVEKTNPNN